MMNPYDVVGRAVDLRLAKPWWKPGRRKIVGRFQIAEVRAGGGIYGPLEREVTLRASSRATIPFPRDPTLT
jgi:hypothetical protein